MQNDQDKRRVASAQALKEVRENMPAILENIALQAQMTKAKYDALIKNGFTAEQAIELCKAPNF